MVSTDLHKSTQNQVVLSAFVCVTPVKDKNSSQQAKHLFSLTDQAVNSLLNFFIDYLYSKCPKIYPLRERTFVVSLKSFLKGQNSQMLFEPRGGYLGFAQK
jgi:hypothetical protein